MPVNWSQCIEEAERMWHTMTVEQIAEHYGVTPTCVRWAFSYYGIENPRTKARRERDVRMIRRYRIKYNWSVRQIASQMRRPKAFVKDALMPIACAPQAALFKLEDAEGTRPKRPVRTARTKASIRPMHYTLFDLNSVAA